MRVDVFLGGTLGYSGFELPRIIARGLVDIGDPGMPHIAKEIGQPAWEVADLPFLFGDFTMEGDKYEPFLAAEEAKAIYKEMADAANLVYVGAW